MLTPISMAKIPQILMMVPNFASMLTKPRGRTVGKGSQLGMVTFINRVTCMTLWLTCHSFSLSCLPIPFPPLSVHQYLPDFKSTVFFFPLFSAFNSIIVIVHLWKFWKTACICSEIAGNFMKLKFWFEDLLQTVFTLSQWTISSRHVSLC